MDDYKQRYGNIADYKKIVHQAHLRTGNICCCCCVNKSVEIHHAAYRRSGDRFGDNIFPVCKTCHEYICHSSTNWVVSKDNPVWKNHNTQDFRSKLKKNYQKLRKDAIKKRSQFQQHC